MNPSGHKEEGSLGKCFSLKQRRQRDPQGPEPAYSSYSSYIFRSRDREYLWTGCGKCLQVILLPR